ncbi:DNA-cytosine methyltransferase [Alicyclobacillus hesperidum URH17-3-68]|uniref:DNA cytosine methyltransferase n=1 Tax=Alicyclobacillus hesperidum TaxID=89784 RepID=UPI000281B874|nr:DNA (cytosine-5-)-methyltransferase [Alicyclobacillus hesperidum]EJY56447.1 DNA-cytosine methyltransferase [Alicyclobacillus hesperidum URH17-3-68]
MTFIDLFAGIGGMRRGLEEAGCSCVGFVERDKFARRSYEAIFNTKGEWSAHDIQTVHAQAMPRADSWTFGFPCQDLSVAGRHRGFTGERSSLFFTVMRLIRELPEDHRPEWLVAENVVGFLSCKRGYDFLAAQTALAESGYDCEWDVLGATSFGIPQHRDRVFLVGHARNRGRRTVFPLRAHRTDPVDPIRQGTGTSQKEQESSRRMTDGTDTIGAPNGLIASAVATPGFIRKHQRRRFKEPDEPMFTLTTMDTHGVLVTRKGRGNEALWIPRDIATCLGDM